MKNIKKYKIFELNKFEDNKAIKLLEDLIPVYIETFKNSHEKKYINDESIKNEFIFKLSTNEYEYEYYNRVCCKDFIIETKQKLISLLKTLPENEIIEFLKYYNNSINSDPPSRILIDKFKHVLNVCVKKNYYTLFKFIIDTYFYGNVIFRSLTLPDIINILLSNKNYIDFEKYYELIKNFENSLNVRILTKLYPDIINLFVKTKAYKTLLDEYGYEDITTPGAKKNGTLLLKNDKLLVYFYVNGKVTIPGKSSMYIKLDHKIKNFDDAEELINLFFNKKIIYAFYWKNRKIINTNYPEFKNVKNVNMYNLHEYINNLFNAIIDSGDTNALTKINITSNDIKKSISLDIMNIINFVL
jgi:hypothetical protein